MEKFQFSFRSVTRQHTLFVCEIDPMVVSDNYAAHTLQLFISRGSIDSFSLISDAAYISASLARIMRALFEICLRRCWCEMSSFLLDYCKAVDHQVWPHQHPLRQFDKDIPSGVSLAYYHYHTVL